MLRNLIPQIFKDEAQRRAEASNASKSQEQMRKDWGSQRTALTRRMERNRSAMRYQFS